MAEHSYNLDISLSLPVLYNTNNECALSKQEKEVSQDIDRIVHEFYKSIKDSMNLSVK